MALRYWFVILLLGLAWGSSFFFNEILLREVGPLSVSMIRIGLGAVGCWAWVLARRIPVSFSKAQLAMLCVFGIVQYALPFTLYSVAQLGITSSAAGIINAATPIMVVIVSHFWPGSERATVAKSAGVAIGFVGILILMLPSARGQGDNALWGLLVALGPALCYALSVNIVRRFTGVDRAVLTAWSLTFGGLLIAPLALSMEGVPVITQPETVFAALFIGFALTSVAFIVMFWLIPIVGGTTASTLTFIAPISAVLLGVLVLNETLEPAHKLGMAIIFVSLLIIDGRITKVLRGRRAALGDHQPNG